MSPGYNHLHLDIDQVEQCLHLLDVTQSIMLHEGYHQWCHPIMEHLAQCQNPIAVAVIHHSALSVMIAMMAATKKAVMAEEATNLRHC